MPTIELPNGRYSYDPDQALGGAGGFGQVFAGQAANKMPLAIKRLHLSAGEAAHRELRIARELSSRQLTHVIPIIDSGEYNDRYFVVMPKAEHSLDNWLRNNDTTRPDAAAKILLQIITGLVEVGDLVHRDLKPANVLWHDGNWKIADFGIARFVEDSTSLQTLKQCLTPEFAAPEQWRFETATHATDIYALGCVAFCLLTGKPPFAANFSEAHQRSAIPSFVCNDARLRTAITLMLSKAAPARPTYQRLQALLQNVVTQPAANLPGPFAELAEAGAQIVDAQQKAEAAAESQRQATMSRIDILNTGYTELRANLQRFVEKITAVAPTVDVSGGPAGLKLRLGGALFEVQFGSSKPHERGVMPQSGWDVLSNTTIATGQDRPEYVWSASLWFMKRKGEADYRWHEVSYWALNATRHQPFALGPGQDADYAASNILHTFNVAFGPIAIDAEDEDEFHIRWALLFSKASKRELRQPSTLPIHNWPPSW